MARIGDFIAFKAADGIVEGYEPRLISVDEVYEKCKNQVNLADDSEVVNYVKEIYAPFTDEKKFQIRSLKC